MCTMYNVVFIDFSVKFSLALFSVWNCCMCVLNSIIDKNANHNKNLSAYNE